MSEVQRVFTADEYASTSTPYEYLDGLGGNPFLQAKEVTRLEEDANKKGLYNTFRRMWKAYKDTMNPNKAAQDHVMEFPELTLEDDTKMPRLDCGAYTCDDSGVSIFDQRLGQISVCSHPIMPVKKIVNLDTNECKTEIAYFLGWWRRTIVDNKVLFNAQKIIELSSLDISVSSENARLMVNYLAFVRDTNRDKLRQVKSIGRLGWMEHGFSPYVKDVLFDGNEQYRHAFEAVKQVGTFEAWRDCIVKSLRAGGSIPARVMLASAFASVLIKPLNALPFIVHCWANKSGSGKTATMMAVSSVWANPSQGEYMKSFNTTNVGIEMLAGFYRDMPLCIDELELKGSKRDTFDTMIYSFCEGVGRMRGAKNGGLQKTLTWNNCMITTGEEPLTSGNSKAGAVNRVLDINNGDADMMASPREALAVLSVNYGHAGRLFVESLKKPGVMDEIRQEQDRVYAQLEGKATDKQRLSASIILAADAWATKVIFRDDRALTVDDLVPYLQSEATTDVNQRAYEWLMDMVSINSARFSTSDNNGEVWGVVEEAEKRVYIIKSVFDRIMQEEGYNSTGFLSWAKGKKLLRTEDGRTTVKKRCGGSAVPPRCVCISMDPAEKPLTDPETGYVVVDEQENMFDMV